MLTEYGQQHGQYPMIQLMFDDLYKIKLDIEYIVCLLAMWTTPHWLLSGIDIVCVFRYSIILFCDRNNLPALSLTA